MKKTNEHFIPVKPMLMNEKAAREMERTDGEVSERMNIERIKCQYLLEARDRIRQRYF